jgi:hypothetical protein
MATAEQFAAFQTAVASGNIQEAANIAALAGYSPQQVAEYVNANAPILGLGPETGFSGVTAANLNPYFVPTPVSGPPSPAVSPVVANPISLTSAGTASLGQPTNASSPVNVFSPADYGPPSPIFDPAPAPVDPNVEKFNSLIREGKFGEAGVLATGLGFTPEQIQSYLNDTNVFPEFGGGVTLKTVQSIVSPPPPPVVSDSPPVINQTSAPTTPPAYDIRDLFLEFLGREPKQQDLDNAQFLYGDKLDTPDEINEFITKSKQEILNRQSFPVNSLFEGGKQPSLEELRRVQNDPLTQALNSYDQYLLAGQYPEAKALLDSTIATYGLNPTESYANMATYLNTNPKFEDVRKVAGNKLFTGENIADFGKPLPPAPVGPAGGIYQRTPEQQAAYASQLASIPVNTAVPLPVMPMSIGPSAAMARIQRTGEMTPEQYYSNIRESVSSGQYTPAQLRQMQQGVGASSQDINVAFGRGMTPIGQLQPGAQPVSVDIPGQYVTTDGGQPKPLSVDISSMPKEQQDLTNFIVGKLPRPTTTAPSMFSPENVRAQLELERLRLQPTPEPPPEEPVAGFAQGGLVSDDINRMLQNQRNAVMRESQSRQMLTNLGAPPVKKFSDGGPAGSSSGVRRLEMSGYQAGGEVTDEMFVGTTPSEESQQTTGEYIKGLYKENIPVHARVYLETLLGKKDPITAEDFTKEELADIEKLLSSKPAKGAVTEYSDYEKVRDLDREGRHSSDWLENLPSVGKTLGRFTYETLPDGRRVIKDTYDFYNTSRSINVQEFEEMGPAEKALAVFKKITANRSMMDPPFVKRAADILGEAYIGRDGRPVKVEYDPKDLPVKRQEGSPPEGEVNENPYVRMAREERAAQDKTFDNVNRQLSDLLKRYKEGDEGITEKDLLPFFPGYNEYDIAQMYGTTTESSVPSMSSKARSFTPEIMSNLRKYDELMQKDFDRLVKEKRLPRDVITARTLGLANGGEVTNDEFIQEMFTGTRPEDFPETSSVDKKAGELLRALSEGTRGFVGAEPIEPGSEAYRTGQALANMPAVGVVAATAKGAGKAKDALKSMLPSAKLVDTPEFQNWFGRSKTVNEGGKPLVLYHATPKDITEFIPGGQNPELSGPAIWMTPNKDFQPAAHNLYTGKGSFVSGANVIPLFASVKNPLITSLRTWKDDLKPFGGSPWTLDKEAVSKMKKAGHDGIMYYDEKGNLEEVAVFKPTQVKSAISNEGTFSPRKKAITKAEGGEVTNDEFIQEMMTGTRPSDFPETSPVDTTVSDYIKFQSKAVTDPKAYMQALGENIKKYHTDPLQQDPQKYLMEQLGPGQGLMGAIKPRGGIMPTTPGTPWGEYIDEVVGAAQKSYANIASDRREGVVDFIKKKLGKYIRSDFGTEEDPLRRAIESGRLETFGKDKDTFRSYALKAAREGDPDAVFDVTKAYDIGTGIRPTVMLPTRDFGEGQLAKQKAVDDLVSKIVAEGGDPEIARSIVERQLRSVSRDETDKALQTGEEGYSKVLKTFGVDKNRPKDMGFFERALDQGDIAYGKDFLNLQFLRPQDLAEALGAIPSNKLASMDFPEAVVEGNRLMKKSRDLDENIKIAEKGKGSTLPKEILFFGTKPLKTPAKSGQWINITDPDAARLEGALMRHSVHGYGKEGPYGLGGKQALLSGKANLFSLRDEKGLPMVTVEMENMAMQKMSDREALKTPDFKVRQVQGKFNSAPEDYIDDVFDLAETINGRWSEGPAGNQRYGKDRSGKDLDEPKIIEWGKLFANRKAQGKAAGGEITKFIKDNR